MITYVSNKNVLNFDSSILFVWVNSILKNDLIKDWKRAAATLDEVAIA